jgi:transcriptional regulator with XRE-family HTH domain
MTTNAMPDTNNPAVTKMEMDTAKPVPMKPRTAGVRPVKAPLYNRVHILLMHAPRYSFQGQARLATDVGCARSTVSRLVNGRTRPSYQLAQAVVAALGRQLQRPLDPADVFSLTGEYPTPSGCALAGCKGCMPEEAYDAQGDLRPEFRAMRPGDWSLSTLVTNDSGGKVTNDSGGKVTN